MKQKVTNLNGRRIGNLNVHVSTINITSRKNLVKSLMI